jgi:hypothetical protein
MRSVFFRFVLITLLPMFFYAQAPDTLWTRSYGGHFYDAGYSVQQTIDGGYIITGYMMDSFTMHAWLLKTDSLGDTIWTNTFGDDRWSFGMSVQQTSDSGYILTGGVGDDDVYTDVY